MMHNNYKTNLKERCDPNNRWEIYDRFPMPIKRALENAKCDYSIISIAELLRAGKYTVGQIIGAINNADKQIIPIVPDEHKKHKIYELVRRIKENQNVRTS